MKISSIGAGVLFGFIQGSYLEMPIIGKFILMAVYYFVFYYTF